MCKLILNGKQIWENPKDLGFFGIKARKQNYEEWLVGELLKRRERKKELKSINSKEQ